MDQASAKNNIASELFELKPATWNSWRAIRTAFCIGFPFAVALFFNDIMTGMWIAMGCLMMATGEGSGSYSSIFKKMLISAPIGASGYLLGYLGILPWAFVVFAMMLVGFCAAYLSNKSSTLSIGTLQALLLASIALGVPAIKPFWQPAALYLVGTLLYSVVLGLEALIRGWHSQDAQSKKVTHSSSAQIRAATQRSIVATAIAFSVCLGVSYSSHWFDHDAHWFWIPLTVGLVMKPDFGSIRDRAIQRTIGTILGVIIGAVILTAVPKGALFIALMAALSAMLPWAMQRSYILQAVFLTPLILMLVDVIVPGTANIDYGAQRLVDTAIGRLIVVLLGYIPLQYVNRLRT
ncbi:FUSC family protein [Ochrobactrum sp. EDr1-4]|uniref:FUSC family protein n=1 Tax=Ochrobactrum sp. EDr1-4 TaxID=3368622 RepID=UPI003BA10186